MLKILRNQKTQKQIYIVLAVAVIATFALSGIYMGKEDKSAHSSLGNIDGHNITIQDYLASYKAVDHQARMMYGNNFDQIRQYINMKGEAWDRLLLLNYAKKQGVSVSDEEIVQWIGSQAFLQNKGRFDEKIYKLFVTEYLHEDARHFEEEVRQTLTIGKIQDKTEASVAISDRELRDLYVQRAGGRQIQYVVFSLSDDKDQADIPEEELKDIYPRYENFLKDPVKARIRYVFIPKEKNETFKEALNDNHSSLDDLSVKYQLKIADTSYFSKNEAIPGLGLINEIIDKTFSLEPRQNSGWLSTDSGSYKIELLDKKPSHKLSFEESKPKLREMLLHQRSVERAMQKLNELSKNLKASEFEKFAADQKLELKSTDHFERGSYLPGIGPSGPIEKALASLKEGEISKVLPVPGGATLVKVLKNQPVDEKKFSLEKEKLKNEAIQEKSRARMLSLLENLRQELKLNLKVLKEIMPDETPAK